MKSRGMFDSEPQGQPTIGADLISTGACMSLHAENRGRDGGAPRRVTVPPRRLLAHTKVIRHNLGLVRRQNTSPR